MKVWLVTGLAVTALAFLAAITFSSSNDTAVDLTWQPKVGASMKYETVNLVETPFGTKVRFTYTTTTSVKEVSEGKVIIDAVSTEPKVDADGPTGCPIQIGGPNGPATFALSGQYVFEDEEDPDAMATRFINMDVFIYPDKLISVGDSWTHHVEADETTGACKAKVTFKYLGRERIGEWDSYKVAIDYGETGGEESERLSAQGNKWFAVEDGTVVREAMKLKAPYGVDSIQIEIESERVE